MEWIRIKFSVLAILLMLSSFSAKSQTWSEWFSQKKTQRKYLIEQLAALKLYTGYLKKGYEIGKSGLGFIKDDTNGEFNLHEVFFTSLKSVSPEISKYPKIAEIMLMQIKIRKVLNGMSESEVVSKSYRSYFQDVEAKLMEHCERNLDDLLLIITSGKVEMEEDKRIKRIDAIYDAMAESLGFAIHFARSVYTLDLQRTAEQKSLKRIGGLYEN
ncbi:MAG: hypothetical protein EOO20_13065 [Chryseobacterium sp.]|nr:MAG: hypothetical protein EOO20_13065 [Chryseobacterium sp.]